MSFAFGKTKISWDSGFRQNDRSQFVILAKARIPANSLLRSNSE